MKRRKILKILGAGSASGTGLASATVGSRKDTHAVPPELEEVMRKYEGIERAEVRKIFDSNTSDFRKTLSNSTESIEGLSSAIPDKLRDQVEARVAESVTGDQASLLKGEPQLSFHISENTPTALILMTAEFDDLALSVATEPETSNQYAVLRFDKESDSGSVVIDGDTGIATPCIEASACKQHYYKPCQDCVYQNKCLYTRINCCQGYCYWGAEQSSLCSCPTCNNCAWHCTDGSCN